MYSKVCCLLFYELGSYERNHSFCCVLCSEDCSTLFCRGNPQRGSVSEDGRCTARYAVFYFVNWIPMKGTIHFVVCYAAGTAAHYFIEWILRADQCPMTGHVQQGMLSSTLWIGFLERNHSFCWVLCSRDCSTSFCRGNPQRGLVPEDGRCTARYAVL